ncbi:hypothetical protein [uncultured Thiohalocapsa sp.]|uniref:hypothetical protein n=1 Tax=uncultured Thiohalocapsa sp. TaxID=768990 RepID=UPI0025F21CA7|nr:hypothetical protein [uncultured Thiohalocapsa sp.]
MNLIRSRIGALGVATLALALQGCLSVPVNLRSEPAGATVRANGKAIGTTPMQITADRVFPAKRRGIGWEREGTLTLERPGCTPKTLEVDNDTLKRSLTVDLECRPDAPAVVSTGATPAPTPAAAPAAPSPTGATAQRLRELEGLRSQGLITEAEYQSIRRRILDRL